MQGSTDVFSPTIIPYNFSSNLQIQVQTYDAKSGNEVLARVPFSWQLERDVLAYNKESYYIVNYKHRRRQVLNVERRKMDDYDEVPVSVYVKW